MFERLSPGGLLSVTWMDDLFFGRLITTIRRLGLHELSSISVVSDGRWKNMLMRKGKLSAEERRRMETHAVRLGFHYYPPGEL